MPKFFSLLIASALLTGATGRAIDFFGLPEKIVVPVSLKPAPPPATPVPATPVPVKLPTPQPIPEPGDPPFTPRNPDLDKPSFPPPRTEPIPEIPPPGSVQVFACAQDQYTLYLNGREILTGADSYEVQSGIFPIVKGDVLAAVVQDTGSGRLWFSLRVVRDGTTILDAGDMRYHTVERPSWKVSKLLSDFHEPKVKTHAKRMGTDARPRAASAGVKDETATTVYFKGVVP